MYHVPPADRPLALLSVKSDERLSVQTAIVKRNTVIRSSPNQHCASFREVVVVTQRARVDPTGVLAAKRNGRPRREGPSLTEAFSFWEKNI